GRRGHARRVARTPHRDDQHENHRPHRLVDRRSPGGGAVMTRPRSEAQRISGRWQASTVGRSRRGLTVVEVLVALVVLGIVTAAVMTTYVSSMRNNADSGRRTQSAQLLNALGRRVAGADSVVLAQ